MFQPNTDTIGRRYEQPPIYNPASTSGMMGVWLHEDEEVDWSISYNPDGTQHCFGYTIKKKGEQICKSELTIGLIDPELFELAGTIVK